MTNIKEDIKLIDYLKEKGISHEDLKKLIDDSIDTALGESEEADKDEPEPEVVEPEKELTYTIEDVKELVDESVKKALKIKRKVPSKGKVIDKTKPAEMPATSREIAAKEWHEVLV